ncbi:MAG: hypothetical protein FWF28_06150, partial [Micrococcales bacterium]|nr:hypothetical protein [Micrococcales bacterium]
GSDIIPATEQNTGAMDAASYSYGLTGQQFFDAGCQVPVDTVPICRLTDTGWSQGTLYVDANGDPLNYSDSDVISSTASDGKTAVNGQNLDKTFGQATGQQLMANGCVQPPSVTVCRANVAPATGFSATQLVVVNGVPQSSQAGDIIPTATDDGSVTLTGENLTTTYGSASVTGAYLLGNGCVVPAPVEVPICHMVSAGAYAADTISGIYTTADLNAYASANSSDVIPATSRDAVAFAGENLATTYGDLAASGQYLLDHNCQVPVLPVVIPPVTVCQWNADTHTYGNTGTVSVAVGDLTPNDIVPGGANWTTVPAPYAGNATVTQTGEQIYHNPDGACTVSVVLAAPQAKEPPEAKPVALAFTGGDVVSTVVLAVLAFLLGSVAVLVSRRRRQFDDDAS